MRLPRRLLVPLGGFAAGVVLLAGCTSRPPGGTSPSPVTVSPSAGAPSAGSSSGGPGSTATTNAVLIGITIKNKQVSPNGAKIEVGKGQTVVLQVTSDADDEIHAHTSGDGYELEVKAGKQTDGQFVADQTGSFEIESHHLDKIIAILVVR